MAKKKKKQKKPQAAASKDTAPGKATASAKTSKDKQATAIAEEASGAASEGPDAPQEHAKASVTPATTRSLRVAQPPPGLMARLFTTGHTEPGLIWMIWLLNLFAAVAWNLACYPFINRLMKGQSSPGIKLLDTSIALLGAFLVLRVVTLLSDLKKD